MDQIERYLKEQDKIIRQDREKTLIALGLTQKEYAPEDENGAGYRYPKYEYHNNEKRYYREVAITVTDEEYELILSKARQVEAIRQKEEENRQKERSKARTVKMWKPVFKKPQETWEAEQDKQEDTGKSRIAQYLRMVGWGMFIVLCIVGIIMLIASGSILFLLAAVFSGGVELLWFCALAAILDHLAELTSIARNGFKYVESGK